MKPDDVAGGSPGEGMENAEELDAELDPEELNKPESERKKKKKKKPSPSPGGGGGGGGGGSQISKEDMDKFLQMAKDFMDNYMKNAQQNAMSQNDQDVFQKATKQTLDEMEQQDLLDKELMDEQLMADLKLKDLEDEDELEQEEEDELTEGEENSKTDALEEDDEADADKEATNEASDVPDEQQGSLVEDLEDPGRTADTLNETFKDMDSDLGNDMSDLTTSVEAPSLDMNIGGMLGGG